MSVAGTPSPTPNPADGGNAVNAGYPTDAFDFRGGSWPNKIYAGTRRPFLRSHCLRLSRGLGSLPLTRVLLLHLSRSLGICSFGRRHESMRFVAELNSQAMVVDFDELECAFNRCTPLARLKFPSCRFGLRRKHVICEWKFQAIEIWHLRDSVEATQIPRLQVW